MLANSTNALVIPVTPEAMTYDTRRALLANPTNALVIPVTPEAMTYDTRPQLE
ncbi:MAG: hypothetical protein ACK4SA_02275 [Caldilinea sp.]